MNSEMLLYALLLEMGISPLQFRQWNEDKRQEIIQLLDQEQNTKAVYMLIEMAKGYVFDSKGK